MSENTIADIDEKDAIEDSKELELPSVDTDKTEKKADEDISAEFEALKEKYIRLSADFDNYKKRLAKEKQEILDFGNAQKLKEFLSVLDNIERAIELSEGLHGEKTDFIAFLDGIRLVHTQFLAGLKNFGVTLIESGQGTSFDPNYHEAVYREYSETHENGAIISEIQKGYLLNGRLLRPSMVSVSQGIEKNPE